ncbi:putative Synaptosomal-associated protein 29 [Hypsibius exemplaris]|uniref:Synaptosomal-associated protein 29 n=1 Tax=Hypsibius exemplaris TaxID=2072580 RepID=A0A1W0WK58_HYPEX|nr:putative Synaptosomal-associated protein 29 [Hypsibius exemplaris]
MEKNRKKGRSPFDHPPPEEERPHQLENNFFDDSHDDDFSSYFNKKRSSTKPFGDDDEEATSSPRSSPQEEVQAIQERTLGTTDRSLRLIDESEAIGAVAAQELLAQREQLEAADRNLDNMNATLDQSQKHINSIKSVFGGIKNWWTAKPAAAPSATAASLSQSDSSRNLREIVEKSSSSATASPTTRSSLGPERNSPYRLSGNDDGPSGSKSATPRQNYDTVLEGNLDQMSLGLSRLKGLAEGLGGEIEVQNRLLDSMNAKTERVDIKIGQQQSHMDKLLGKKK